MTATRAAIPLLSLRFRVGFAAAVVSAFRFLVAAGFGSAFRTAFFGDFGCAFAVFATALRVHLGRDFSGSGGHGAVSMALFSGGHGGVSRTTFSGGHDGVSHGGGGQVS